MAAPDTSNADTIEIDFMPEEIHAGLHLAVTAARKARDRGSQEGVDIAHGFIDVWLDRLHP